MNHRRATKWWAPEGDGPLSAGPDNPQLNLNMTRLEKLCANGPGLYAVETRYDDTAKYGKVEVKVGRIFIYSFHEHKPSRRDTKFITLRELLSRFSGSTDLPISGFLQVMRKRRTESVAEEDYENSYAHLIFDDDSDDELYKVPMSLTIETDGVSPRAKNFCLLCSALKGRSYKGTQMRGCCYWFETDRSPYPLVQGINYVDGTLSLMDACVYGMPDGNSWFKILLRDFPNFTAPKFGVVVSGLESLRERRGRFKITECGLVI